MAWDSMRSDWNFDTIRSTPSAMGTFKSMARDLVSSSEISEDGDAEESGMSSIESGAATQGSDPNGGIGMNAAANHSTVVIKPDGSEEDMATLLKDAPVSPNGDMPPPAYGTGSMRGSRRSSYAARHAAGGLVMKEGDVGTGVDTIRPIKKLDTAGSLRLSAEYVGSMRKASGSAPPSPTSHRRAASELGRTGASIIDEVVQPILQKVRPSIASHRIMADAS